MIQVDARLGLGAVTVDAKCNFHKIARLAKRLLHDLNIAGALLLVHLRSEASRELQDPMARPAFILARLLARLTLEQLARLLAVAVNDFPRKVGGLGSLRECLVADVPNLLPPRRMRPMRFRTLGDSQGEEIVNAGLAGVRAGLDDQRFAFGIRSAGVVERPHNDTADGRSDIYFCHSVDSLVCDAEDATRIGGIIGNQF